MLSGGSGRPGRFLESCPCRGWSRAQEGGFRCLGAQVAKAGWALACGGQPLGVFGEGQVCPGFCANSLSGHTGSHQPFCLPQVSLLVKGPWPSHTVEHAGTSSVSDSVSLFICKSEVLLHRPSGTWHLHFWQSPLGDFPTLAEVRNTWPFHGLGKLPEMPWVSHLPGPEFQGMRAATHSSCVHPQHGFLSVIACKEKLSQDRASQFCFCFLTYVNCKSFHIDKMKIKG